MEEAAAAEKERQHLVLESYSCVNGSACVFAPSNDTWRLAVSWRE